MIVNEKQLDHLDLTEGGKYNHRQLFAGDNSEESAGFLLFRFGLRTQYRPNHLVEHLF